MPILAYILKRILQAIPLLVIVSILSFVVIKMSPVDPLAELKMNPAISPETLQAEKVRLGLDLPVHEQYFRWAGNFIRGDLGVSTSGEKVIDRLMERIPNTLLLTTTVILLTWLIAIPLGIYAALNWKKTADRVLTVISSMGMAIPSFFFALLLLIMAVKTGWFPVGGLTSVGFENFSLSGKILDVAYHLVLPVTVLTTISLSGLQRQMRGNLLDVLESDYVKMARAKGLPENMVIYKHAVRNAINPMVTLLGFEFASLLNGAALTEFVLQYPGIGRLILEAVMRSDINLVMASLMIGSIMLILGNLIADILLKIVDPRVSLN
jgi:peptide/nickel transport system permease protein